MKTLVVLLGPTGVGKTALSFALAERLGSPILSADSRQLYAEIPIGTAAPTKEEQERVKHYFIGTHQLTDYYSAAQYEIDVLKLTEELFHTHDVLFLTGGSMMYIDAVCKGIDDIPTVDDITRRTLLDRYEQEGEEFSTVYCDPRKGFGVVSKPELDVFLEPACFFNDPTDVDNLISGSSAFSKSSLNIWKFTYC